MEKKEILKNLNSFVNADNELAIKEAKHSLSKPHKLMLNVSHNH